MSTGLADRIRGQTEREQARTGYPEGFPALPPTPAARYTDPGFYALEQEAIFGRSWLLAGHVSDLPDPGSYRRFDRLGVPIFLIRGRDGQIRGFYNTCQHRGAPVVREEAGRAARLVCQYHAWSYDTAGNLLSVPHERDFCALDKEHRALRPVRCETWQGFVFINRDPHARPLGDFLAPVDAELGDQICGPRLRAGIRRNEVVRCNWKIAQEAFLEAYHVPAIHPQTAARVLDYAATAIGLLPNGHSRMMHGLNTERAGASAGATYGFEPIPTAGPLLGSFSSAYSIFPNITCPLNPYLLPMINFWPVDIETTLIEWVVYGYGWDGPDVPAAYAAFERAFAVVMEEDYANLAPMQASVASGALEDVPLCYQERRIYHFNLELDRCIGRSRIPAHLRTPLVDLPMEPAPAEAAR
jgi:phenylpropionate dioxygenase-like ring-hydroxylating dioxygenase large terminal subunit